MVLKARQCSLNGFPRAVSDHAIDVRFVFQTKSKACALRRYYGVYENLRSKGTVFVDNEYNGGAISSDD